MKKFVCISRDFPYFRRCRFLSLPYSHISVVAVSCLYLISIFPYFLFHIPCLYAHELLIADFESKSGYNNIGGINGTWDKDPNDNTEYCNMSFVDLDAKYSSPSNRGKSVLRLEYLLKENDYNGYYTKLNGLDLRPYQYLSFYVKGDEKFCPETIKIELKNPKQTDSYLVDVSTNWEKLLIPLEKFSSIKDFSNVSEIGIVFEGSTLGTSYGSAYIDDILFSANDDYYETQLAKIRQQEKKLKRDAQKLAKLTDDELLETISKRMFKYFLWQTNSLTGNVKDRARLYMPSSVAATGYGLTALCIGVERGWISEQDGYERVRTTLDTLLNKDDKVNGFFYHFVNVNSGKREWNCEVSSVDTALLLAGVITAREYFSDSPQIVEMADEIYKAVQWDFMLEPEKKMLYMGWDPESKFKKYILWDMFGEEMLMYILGLGSPTHPLPRESWDAFQRPIKNFGNRTYIHCDSESLFTYQYSHSWIDFRNIHDKYTNYFDNTVSAIKYNQWFCKEHRDKSKTYKEGYWGVSACDGPDGYKNYGATVFTNDGTVAPYAICGSLPFVPKESMSTIRRMMNVYGSKVFKEYGFVSALNLDKKWFSEDFVGIDVGTSLLMIENYRSGFVWKYFMRNKYVREGLKKAGFRNGRGKINLALLREQGLNQQHRVVLEKVDSSFCDKIVVDGKIDDWGDDCFRYQFNPQKHLEYGVVSSSSDIAASFGFRWDEKNLYFACKVTDDKIIAKEKKNEIYKGDCVELYLNPSGDFLVWGNKENFQIGFSPDSSQGGPVCWLFFQNMESNNDIQFVSVPTNDGYTMEASISWKLLGMKSPEIPTVPGLSARTGIGFSVAIHDVDVLNDSGKKLNYSFKSAGDKIYLGEMVLTAGK